MTEKRFKMIITNADGSFHYLDEITGEKITSTLALEDKLNELSDEKEKWKSASVIASNENSILWDEIHILMEQGAEPSDAFKKYLESISTKHTKFWQRKLEKAKKDGVIE